MDFEVLLPLTADVGAVAAGLEDAVSNGRLTHWMQAYKLAYPLNQVAASFLWAGGTFPPPPPPSPPAPFRPPFPPPPPPGGKVIEIINGDALMVKRGKSDIKKVHLASIRPPR